MKNSALDPNGIVVDIGRAHEALKAILEPINYRNLDQVPDFDGANTTTEYLTRHVFEGLATVARTGGLGRDGRELRAIRVTISESHLARAGTRASRRRFDNVTAPMERLGVVHKHGRSGNYYRGSGYSARPAGPLGGRTVKAGEGFAGFARPAHARYTRRTPIYRKCLHGPSHPRRPTATVCIFTTMVIPLAQVSAPLAGVVGPSLRAITIVVTLDGSAATEAGSPQWVRF